MKKNIISLILISTMALSSLLGCTSSSIPANETPSNGTSGNGNPLIKDTGQVVISLATELQTLNTFAMQNIVTNECISNIYDTFLNVADDGTIIPNVAESWEWIEDENKYRFKIKKGIKFHDGSELKASDAAFTFNLMMTEYKAYQAATANQIKEVKLADDYTVDVYLNNPSANFLYLCAINVKMYSEKAYNETNKYKDTVISCGPYKLVSYDPTIGVELEAFEDYHGDIKPKIKKAVFKIIPDANTQVVALETGELNLSRDFAMIALKNIKENPNLDFYSHPCGLINFIQFNQRDNTIEPLKNKKVRQAINYCFDKDFMIQVAEEGMAVPARSVANQGMFGYSEKIPYYGYDVEKAKELMKEAGYENGFKFDAIITRDGKDKKIAEIALENLKAIGIETTVQVVENNAFIDDLKTGNFVMASSHLNLNSDGDNAMDVISITGSIPFSGINDEWIEEQNKLQKIELDSKKRFDILESILVRTSEEAYFAPIYYPKKSYAITKGLNITGYDKFVGVQLKYLEWAE